MEQTYTSALILGKTNIFSMIDTFLTFCDIQYVIIILHENYIRSVQEQKVFAFESSIKKVSHKGNVGMMLINILSGASV